MDIDLLKNLTAIVGVSGREEKITEYLKKYFESIGYCCFTDGWGNIFIHLNGDNEKRLMFTAHIDEVGFMVADCAENGLINVMNIGGNSPTKNEKLISEKGILGLVVRENENSFLTVDIGANSREEASKLVSPGDVFGFYGETVLQGSKVIGRALDNRAGVSALIESLKTAKIEATIVFTVREEISGNGAIAAIQKYCPDIVCCVDTSVAKEIYGEKNKSNILLGDGPGIKVADACTVIKRKTVEKLTRIAEALHLRYQLEIGGCGTTEIFALERCFPEIEYIGISLPMRNIHSGKSIIDVKDYNALVKLLSYLLKNGI